MDKLIYRSQMFRYAITTKPISEIPYSEMQVLLHHAKIKLGQFKNGEITFRSKVYDDDAERLEMFMENNITGLAGELVINQYCFGQITGLRMFNEERTKCNHNPIKSDKGSDVLGFPIDVKTTHMRHIGMIGSHFRRKLAVREGELHDGNIYVLALIENENIDDIENPTFIIVDLVGWCWGEDLPDYADGEGSDYKGAYTKLGQYLHPMTSFPYQKIGFPREPIGNTMFKCQQIKHDVSDQLPTEINDKGEWQDEQSKNQQREAA